MPTEWDQARHVLRPALGAMFDIWVAPVRLHGVDEQSTPTAVHLVAPNEVFRSWIQGSYQADIEGALRGVIGRNDVSVHFWVENEDLPQLTGQPLPAGPPAAAPEPVPPSLFPSLPPPAAPSPRGTDTDARVVELAARQPPREPSPTLPQPQLFPPSALPAPVTGASAPAAAASRAGGTSALPPDKTFEHFVVGGCNQFAHAAACSVAEDPSGQRYNPLFIYGGTGLGKTHLMVAVGHQRCVIDPSTRVLYVTSEQFTNDLIDSLRFKRMSEFRAKYRHNVDLLLMDDIQFVSGKERTQEELFHTFEWLRERGKQIVFTADVLPREIRGLEDRLRTRCESGMLADMQPPDLETLVAILHEKSEACGRPLPSDVAEYVAARVRGSIREIEGVVNRIDALCSLYRQSPTVGFVRAHLGNVLPDGPPTPEPEDILREVANVFAVPVSAILSPQRSRRIAHPRHVAMFLVRKHTDASFPDIGAIFHRDHTTVHHGCRKIEHQLETDIELRQQVHIIERTIGC